MRWIGYTNNYRHYSSRLVELDLATDSIGTWVVAFGMNIRCGCFCPERIKIGCGRGVSLKIGVDNSDLEMES